ncbi:V-type proton ATPase subunit e-like [Cimex lectularius]|uniref:V-type proton ATPase subunit n=1 Tax=Cimex lectularius TaxID=79782 RepID=A0A8I6RP29_CIMLE|nr:V-type proton ATPase subunit e-like [Cimex lectularius]
MGFSFLPVTLMTAFWGAVGVVLPIFLPKGDNRGLIQLSLGLTAICSWLFWLCTYMAQMNPLVGPRLSTRTILIMSQEWGNKIADL